MKLKRQQRGLTFLSLVVVGVLLALAGLVAAQVFPTYLEYMAVQKAVKQASAGSTVAEVRSIFDKAAAIDDIRTIGGKDLTVSKAGDKVVVSFDYMREIHLAGPAWLTMKYQGSSQ
jgi:Tfp pilus assembly protein PilE